MKLKHDGTYVIWNYWEPAGAWDYKSDGLPKHWIGVHPNAAYYDIDVEGIVAAYKHGLVFNKAKSPLPAHSCSHTRPSISKLHAYPISQKSALQT
jgi:hypothetical protein